MLVNKLALNRFEDWVDLPEFKTLLLSAGKWIVTEGGGAMPVLIHGKIKNVFPTLRDYTVAFSSSRNYLQDVAYPYLE